MYECYEHIVFLIWFNDLFGIPMAVEIFHNNSLWQSELLLIRWKLMQMSNVNKFVIHKYNIWCWSETIKQSAAGGTGEMSCTSLGTESRQERNATSQTSPEPSSSPSPCSLSSLSHWALPKEGLWSEFVRMGRVMQVLSPVLICLMVWGWDLMSLFLKGLFRGFWGLRVWSWKWLVMQDIPVN